MLVIETFREAPLLHCCVLPLKLLNLAVQVILYRQAVLALQQAIDRGIHQSSKHEMNKMEASASLEHL